MFPYFQIFGKTIGSYGLCAIIGLVLCGLVASVLARRYQVAYEDVILLMVVIGISLVIGGHLLFGITNLNKVIALFSGVSSYTWKDILAYLIQYFGGMVYYGGFLGGCVGLFIYTRVAKDVERSIAFDLYAVSIPLFHVFGRIGCFLSGCCYGMESEIGFIVHGNALVPEINDVRRLPVPLIEAFCNIIIFVILLRLFMKGKEKGKMIWYYMLIYPVIRFCLEFFRGDAIRGFLFGLSTSQWISIGLFVVAIWKLFLSKSKGKKGMVCAGLALVVMLLVGAQGTTYIAQADTVTEAVDSESVEAMGKSTEEEAAQTPEGNTTEENLTGEVVSETQTQTLTAQGEPFTGKQKFVIFVCCFFSVALCLVVGLFGNPKDRLKDRYKRERKRQALEQKKREEREKRAAKFAAEDAKFAKEEEEYQKALAEYEEAKRKKAEEKAEKKRLKTERKNQV